jgi:hypothetical protein
MAETTRFVVVADSTNVLDGAKVQTALNCANATFDAMLAHPDLTPGTDLSTNKIFLKTFAQEIVSALNKAQMQNYNAILGCNLVRVLRYEKNSLITLSCGPLSLVLFKCPSTPQYAVVDPTFKQAVDPSALESRQALS